MGFLGWSFKMLISIGFDVADFFVGRIPIAGSVFDIIGGILGFVLWGLVGGLQFGELIDVTDQIDAFIPTLTIAGILRARSEI